MKLLAHQIVPFVFGARKIQMTSEQSLRMQRFSDEQLLALAGYDVPYKKQISSIYLEMKTDAEAIRLSYTNAESNLDSSLLSFAAYEDGFLVSHVINPKKKREGVPDPITLPAGEIVFPLNRGLKTVTLYFPMIYLEIAELVLEGATVAEPAFRSGKTVAIGDSITEGSCCKVAGMGYFDALCRLLNSEPNNFAICGSGFRTDRLPKGQIPPCDRVIVALGTNDYTYQTKEFFDEVMPRFFADLFSQVEARPVYVILPFWRESEKERFQMGLLLDEVREKIAKEAKRYPNAVVINGKSLLPNARAFTYDGVHPNALGGAHVARALYEKIKACEYEPSKGE